MTAVLLEQQRSAIRLNVYEISSFSSPGFTCCQGGHLGSECVQVGTALLYDIYKRMSCVATFPLQLSVLPLRQVLKGCLRVAESKYSALVRCVLNGDNLQRFKCNRTFSNRVDEIYTAAGLCLSCLENGDQPMDSCKHEEDKAMAGPLEST